DGRTGRLPEGAGLHRLPGLPVRAAAAGGRVAAGLAATAARVSAPACPLRSVRQQCGCPIWASRETAFMNICAGTRRARLAAFILLVASAPVSAQGETGGAATLRLECGGIGLEESQRMRAEVAM